jgi:hypothetical protein
VIMSGQRQSEDTGQSLGSAVLRALGHGCLIAAAGIGITAMLGVATVGLGSAAVAAIAGICCMIAADAVQDTAIAAATVKKHECELEQYRAEDAAVALDRELGLQAPTPAEQRRSYVAVLQQEREELSGVKGR